MGKVCLTRFVFFFMINDFLTRTAESTNVSGENGTIGFMFDNEQTLKAIKSYCRQGEKKNVQNESNCSVVTNLLGFYENKDLDNAQVMLESPFKFQFTPSASEYFLFFNPLSIANKLLHVENDENVDRARILVQRMENSFKFSIEEMIEGILKQCKFVEEENLVRAQAVLKDEEISLVKHCQNSECLSNQQHVTDRTRLCKQCHSPLVKTARLDVKKNSFKQLQSIVAVSNSAENFCQLNSEVISFEHSKITNALVFKDLTFQRETDTSQLFIQEKLQMFDPVIVNPNSLDSIKKVLKEIKEIANVGKGAGQRNWIILKCDGVPYRILKNFLLQDDQKEYDWILLLPGELHLEMNMLKSFVHFNWSVGLSEFASQMGWTSEGQQSYFKSCGDHHKSWELICEIFLPAMLCSLWEHFKQQHEAPHEIKKFLGWLNSEETSTPNLNYWAKQILYLLSVKLYRQGVRENNYDLRLSAARYFSSHFHSGVHPIWHAIFKTGLKCIRK
eukprot:Pompholyxophrys_punicea_v1_NODE_10_length_6905_cov_7.951686.p1 type:complete len:503 gc:universal NODE_10_length_6905_cov_7.951686:2403-895(-)